MTPTEFKQCRQTLGLTQSELARLLRMAENGARSIRHYEAGTRPVPGPTSLVLDMLCNGYNPIAERRMIRLQKFIESDATVTPHDTPLMRYLRATNDPRPPRR